MSDIQPSNCLVVSLCLLASEEEDRRVVTMELTDSTDLQTGFNSSDFSAI